MKKSLLITLFAAMPLMAQECPQKPECAPQHPCCFGKMHRPHGPRPELTEEQKAEMKAKFEARRAEMLAKFDADKDGKLSEDERKAAREARKAEMKAKFMEKFDADKDGQLSDAEKEAAKAEFGKRGPRHHGKCCGPKGPRPELTEEQKAEMKAKFMEKFDADKDGQLSDAEKEAAKAEFKKHGPRHHGKCCGHKGPRHHGKCCGPKGPRPELTEEQKAEMKAKFEARKAKFMEKFDTNKDGQISDDEKEAIKAAHEARKAEMKAKFMEKFDTDKDGQISDAEKEAIKAEFGKRGPRRPHGPRHGKCCGPKCDKH
ncbi:MAG: hypothetical protein IJX33_01415 [Akkermansia sp.]|nr:hypothetical protein [Akkermansia sp.]